MQIRLDIAAETEPMRMSVDVIRQTVRGLWRRPAFAGGIVASLALGVGVNCAVFAVMNAVLLRPLPYAKPAELVSIGMVRNGVAQDQIPAMLADEWQRSSHTLSGVALHVESEATIVAMGEAFIADAAAVSPGIFALLGARPELGRMLDPSDAVAGAAPVAVVSHALWQGQLGGDSLVVGRTVQINDRPVTVIGVMESSFEFPARVSIWLPWIAPPPGMMVFVGVIGRRALGASIEQVRAELNHLSSTVLPPPAIRTATTTTPFVVTSLHDRLFGSARAGLLLAFTVALLLLVVAGANVADLMVARAQTRHHELAVRAALGASRGELVRPIVLEALMLGLIADVVGLALASWIARLFLAVSPATIRNAVDIGVGGRVVLFGTLITILIAGVVAVVAAGRVHRLDSRVELRSGTSSTGDASMARMRMGLIVAQLAMTVLLLTGAGLLLTSLSRLTHVDLGFHADNVLTARVALPRTRYARAQDADAFFQSLTTRLRTIPGVRNVSYGIGPLSRFTFLETRAPGTRSPDQPLAQTSVSSEYFSTYGIPVRGRAFAMSDDSSSGPVVILNATAARIFFPEGNPVGQHFDRITLRGRQATVVGVADDVHQEGVATPAVAQAYLPSTQFPGRAERIALRVDAGPQRFTPLLRAAIRELDPTLAAGQVTTMRAMVDSLLAPQRFMSLLLVAFATTALIIAGFGLYSVLAFLVVQRAREIGIRVALGARAPQVMRLVAGEAAVMAAIGILSGLVVAAAAARLVRSFLYQTSTLDPVVFVCVPVLLLAVALAAAALPTRRALRLDPVAALRTD